MDALIGLIVANISPCTVYQNIMLYILNTIFFINYTLVKLEKCTFQWNCSATSEVSERALGHYNVTPHHNG